MRRWHRVALRVVTDPLPAVPAPDDGASASIVSDYLKNERTERDVDEYVP